MPVTTTRRERHRRRRRYKIKNPARFFMTPKGILLLVLIVLSALAEHRDGLRTIGILLASVAGAVVPDLLIVGWRRRKYAFPDGALLSGLIVGGILAPTAAWPVGFATAAIAVLSKHFVRTRWSNVFNPAALGLVVSSVLFASEQSWWAALPDLPPLWIVVLIGLGVYIAAKVNKLPLVLVFLAASLTVFSTAAFVGDAPLVAEIFRPPDIDALLFFALLMLTDPPTSPAKPEHQVWFGLIVAAASCFAFLRFGALWFLTGGLLVGNGYESLRRLLHRRSLEAARLRQAAAG